MTYSTDEPTVIVGASVSGAATARSLRAHGYRGPILLVGDEGHLPYDRPPLSKGVLTGKTPPSSLTLLTKDDAQALEVNLEVGVKAVSLDVASQRISLSDGRSIPYARLVIATGVRARTIETAKDMKNVFTLRTLDDAISIGKRLARSQRLAILGAGFIGLEVAASAREMGLEVDIIEPTSMPLFGRVPEYVSRFIQKVHERNGVRFHFGTFAAEWLSHKGEFIGARLSDNRLLEADACVIGIGATPNSEWIEGSSIRLGNGVLCDEDNRAAENIFAVGDIAALPSGPESYERVEHRSIASAHAERVASLICGGSLPAVNVPYFWSDQFQTKLQMHGRVPSDGTFELVDENPEEGKFTGLVLHEGTVQGVIGCNSAGKLIRMRREYLAA